MSPEGSLRAVCGVRLAAVDTLVRVGAGGAIGGGRDRGLGLGVAFAAAGMRPVLSLRVRLGADRTTHRARMASVDSMTPAPATGAAGGAGVSAGGPDKADGACKRNRTSDHRLGTGTGLRVMNIKPGSGHGRLGRVADHMGGASKGKGEGEGGPAESLCHLSRRDLVSSTRLEERDIDELEVRA